MWFYGREFPAQKPIFTNGLTSQVYIAPGKLSEPQSGSDLMLSLQALMKYFFNLYCTIVDGVLTEKKTFCIDPFLLPRATWNDSMKTITALCEI